MLNMEKNSPCSSYKIKIILDILIQNKLDTPCLTLKQNAAKIAFINIIDIGTIVNLYIFQIMSTTICICQNKNRDLWIC